jgi:GNAT superfamily N-acetyltransferase
MTAITLLPPGYRIDTDPANFDLEIIYRFLSETSYWSKDIPRDTFDKSIANSLCFGVLTSSGQQAGFARIVTDYATFAWIADVFILPEHRSKGLSKALFQAILAHPGLQVWKRVVLATLDAHSLYEKFGFHSLSNPERFMEIRYRNIAPINPS